MGEHVGDTTTREFVCVSTFLPVRRWRDVIPFLRMSGRVEKQLKNTQGLIRYAVKGKLLRKHFWTFSVWENKESVEAFVRAEPHNSAVGKFHQWADAGGAFVQWTSSDDSIRWDEAMERLKNSNSYHSK